MEDTASSTTGSTSPAPRPPVRRSRPAGSPARATNSSAAAPTNIHAFAPWALVAAVIILALAVLGVISVPGQKSEAWQAVFLTNGQAYFGHVVRVTPSWLTLRDVYYIQAAPSPQSAVGQPASPDITLVKLGKEIYGPADEMRINREHVLFMEALREDSDVVKTIARSRASAASPATGGPGGSADGTTPPPTNAPSAPPPSGGTNGAPAKH